MNYLKAVILLWTCIIAFHASVTAFVVQDFNISAIKVNSRGGLLKTFDVFFQRIRNEENQHLFDEVFGTPEATHGPTQHITQYHDKKTFVEKMGDLYKKHGINITLRELIEKQLQFNPSQKEMSTKLIQG
eukprot:XP_003241458.2 PREDICTED: uncharacterized protein LOC100571346 [Acyrthosiphon pisum]